MSEFGKTLFGGSRFIFWALAPFLLLFAVGFPFWMAEWTLASIAAAVVFESLMLLLLPALYDPQRFRWAARAVAALVFCVTLAYFVAQLYARRQPPLQADGQAQPSLDNAMTALITFGLPCLWFSVFGRWRLSRKESSKRASKLDALNLDI